MSKLVSTALLAALVSIAPGQTKVLLYDFEARGVDASVIRTTSQLLRDALNGTYKYIVVDPAPETYCYNVVAAAESAKVYGAGQALIGNIMTIGGKQFLTYQLVDAASSTVLLADKITTPEMDEYPVMTGRIARSIVEREPYGETAEPEAMTTAEVEPKFKHPRKPYAGVFLSAGYLFTLQPRHFTYEESGQPRTADMSTNLVNLNMAVSFETQQLLAMLQLGLMRGVHSEQDLAFEILGNYIVGRGDFAPFVGGGIGVTRYSWMKNAETQHNDGMSLSAGAGMLGLRTYYFRLLLAAYGNLTVASNDWGPDKDSKLVPGVRVMFGVSTPTLGPDATVKTHPACVGAAIGGFFLTGLIIALSS